jgi:hypothetical protein
VLSSRLSASTMLLSVAVDEVVDCMPALLVYSASRRYSRSGAYIAVG